MPARQEPSSAPEGRPGPRRARPAILLGLALCGAGSVAGATDADIDRFARAEMELNGIPGLALAIAVDGRVAHATAYGVRSVASREPMLVDTPVELASLSKALTALAVLRLEGDGVLDRGAGVDFWLPEFRAQRWNGVTLRDLLQHRSGLRRRHDFLAPCCGRPGEGDLDAAVERLAGALPESPPGETYSYANSNYVLLAAVVERASGGLGSPRTCGRLSSIRSECAGPPRNTARRALGERPTATSGSGAA